MVLHSALTNKSGLRPETTPYWKYQPPKVDGNENIEILWDRTAYTYKSVAHNRPDIILKDKKQRRAYLIDVAVPSPNNAQKTIYHKVEKYRELSMELEKQWKMRIRTLPIVLTTTGAYPKATMRNLMELGYGKAEIRAMQEATILHVTRTVRKVLGE